MDFVHFLYIKIYSYLSILQNHSQIPWPILSITSILNRLYVILLSYHYRDLLTILDLVGIILTKTSLE
jgi:hypothetical protein